MTHFFKNPHWPTFAIIAILLSASLALFSRLEYPNTPDAGRDYLISRHIIAYHEYPRLGPTSSVYGLLNSPLYYYFLSVFLFVKDDVLFLSIINIFLQLLTVFLIYALAKNLFCTTTAITAAALFGFSTQLADQAQWFWQPHVMPPFLLASTLLLVRSFRRQKYIWLLASLAFFLFAGTLHNAAFALGPLFLLIAWLALRRQKSTIWHYKGFIALACILFVIFYSSVVFSFQVQKLSLIETILHGKTSAGAYAGNAYVASWTQFFAQLSEGASAFVRALFYVSGNLFSLNTLILLILSACILRYLINPPPDQPEGRRIMIFLLAAVLSNIIFFAFFSVRPASYYFTAVYGLCVIMSAEALRRSFSFQPLPNFFLLPTALLLIYAYSGDWSFFRYATPLSKGDTIHAATYALKEEILYIQEREGRPDLHFFQLKYFNPYVAWLRDYDDALLFALLEKETGQQLTELTSAGRGFAVVGDDTYVFITCYDYPTETEARTQCVDSFLSDNRERRLLKTVFSEQGLSIYLFGNNPDATLP